MDIRELKQEYEKLLSPIFGEQLCINDREESHDWVDIVLDGKQEDFCIALYGIDCVRLYWCNECFIFDQYRNALVSSDTYGEIVFEHDFDIAQLPKMIVELIQNLKDCIYVEKKETVKGTIPSGYDKIKDYVIIAKTKDKTKSRYQIGNITIEYIYEAS